MIRTGDIGGYCDVHKLFELLLQRNESCYGLEFISVAHVTYTL